MWESRAKEDVDFLCEKHERERYDDGLEKMVREKNPNDLPTFKKLIMSTGMIKTPTGFRGTIFLAEIDGIGPCLLSAGHLFKGIVNDNEVDKTEEQLQNFQALFGEIEGNFPDSPGNKLEKEPPCD